MQYVGVDLVKIKNSNRWFWIGLKLKRDRVRATIVTTNRCPLLCSYCPMYIREGIGNQNIPKECSFEEWKTFIKRYPNKIGELYVSGGEPTLYKDLVPLVNWLVHEYKTHVLIFTNLWKPETFEGIKPHRRLMFMPTFHKFDKWERFEKALKKIQGKYLVNSQQLLANEHDLKRIKEYFANDYFEHIDNNITFTPDAPRTLRMYLGAINSYMKGA